MEPDMIQLTIVLLFLISGVGASSHDAYVAKLEPLDRGCVTGTAVAFIADDSIAYAGFGKGFEANLGAEECTATNGCGVHIHEGKDCTDAESQGGHFFEEPVMEDPWTEDRYTSDENGDAKFAGIVDIGTTDVAGRAFLVHAADGSRVACGLLEPVDPDTTEHFTLLANSLTEQDVSAFAMVVAGVGGNEADGNVCFYGQAAGLSPGLRSVLSTPTPGSDCTATNGCGVHIHSGPSCDTTETQGGHYYNKDVLDEDPWEFVGYESTNDDGDALFVDCVATGHTDFSQTVMIIHEDDGTRVACSALYEDDDEGEGKTVGPAPTSSPTAGPDDAPAPSSSPVAGEDGTDDASAPNSSPVAGEDGTDDAPAPSSSPVAGEDDAPAPSSSPVAGEDDAPAPSSSPVAGEDGPDEAPAPSSSPVAGEEDEVPTAGPDAPAPTSSPGTGGEGGTELEKRIFTATLSPIGESKVEGTVVVFIADDEKTVGYAGSGTGLDANLGAEDCTATNGCGVHIHSGFDCGSVESQGGHFFVDPVTEDPWTDDRFTTDESGEATFSGIANIGTDDVVGRVFLLHAPDGSRVACGILEPALEAPGDLELYLAQLEPLSDSGVTGVVRAASNVGGAEDKICFFGEATALEPNLKSQLLPTTSGTPSDELSAETATDCTAANGCGAHVHEGNFCVSPELQGGHLYNKDTLEEDPWALIGYEMTDASGMAYFVECVETGVEGGFDGRVFIVHANDGSRVSCGPLGALEQETSSAFIKSVFTASLALMSVAILCVL